MGDIREKLIEEVKSYPSLYDKTNEDYKKYELRVQAWTAIGGKLGLSASDAQSKWKNLRDNMVKHMKRNMNHVSSKRVKQYKFAIMLDFIVPFLDVTRAGDATDETNGLDMECEHKGDNNAGDYVESSAEYTIPEGVSGYAGISNTAQTQPPSASAPPQNSMAGPSPPTKRKRRSVANKSEPVFFADHPPRQTAEVVDQDQDDIGLFLSSMAGSIRKLPPEVQARVRFSIHKIVHSAEMEYLYPRSKGE